MLAEQAHVTEVTAIKVFRARHHAGKRRKPIIADAMIASSNDGHQQRRTKSMDQASAAHAFVAAKVGIEGRIGCRRLVDRDKGFAIGRVYEIAR